MEACIEPAKNIGLLSAGFVLIGDAFKACSHIGLLQLRNPALAFGPLTDLNPLVQRWLLAAVSNPPVCKRFPCRVSF